MIYDPTNIQKTLLLVSMIFVGLLGSAPDTIALNVGEKAPDFKLPATTGEKISLSQFKGKKIVLLEFYGADFSPV